MINETPLISVVTVTYNAASVLEDTILSVINQTYDNIEYLIIDGGSTDGTVDIIKKYQDKISYWISEPDKGIYDAMNKGIEKTTGQWVNFMNAGDIFYNENTLNDVFMINKDNISDADIIYGDTKFRSKYYSYVEEAGNLEMINYFGLNFCHQSAFIRSNHLKKELFDISYKLCADYKQIYAFYKKELRFIYIPIVFSIFSLLDSVSGSNRISLFKEKSDINGFDKHSFWRLKLFLFSTRILIGKVLNRSLSNDIIIMKRKERLVRNQRVRSIELYK